MSISGLRSNAPARWREEEDNILRAYVKQYTGMGCATDWSCVAEKLPRRTNRDCRKRWVNHVCGGLRKGPWEPDEDMMLRNAVAQHGQKWTLVASEVGSRSADQCSKRWQHNLDPRLDHQRWTPKEDELLLESVERYGREWRKIQEKHYSTRSANDLKNRFTTISKKIRSRTSSRSGLDPNLRHSSSTSGFVVEEQDQESTDSGSTNHPNWSMSSEENGVGLYIPNDVHVGFNDFMQSSRGVQQQQEQDTRSGQHMRHGSQIQTQGQAAPLLPLNTDDHTMTIDDLEHTPSSRIFPWTTSTAATSGTVPRPFVGSDFSANMVSNSLTAMIPHNQTASSDSNVPVSGSHVGDTNMGGLVLGFDTIDSISAGTKDGSLQSLLGQRVSKLGNCTPGGSVSLQGEGCDGDVLNYLLDVLLPIRHLVKIEINM